MTITGLALLGVALLVVGWLAGIWICWVLGFVALVVALVLVILGLVRPARHY